MNFRKKMQSDSKFESDCIFPKIHIFVCTLILLVRSCIICCVCAFEWWYFDMIIDVLVLFINSVVIVVVILPLIVLKRFWHNVCCWAQCCVIIQSVNSYRWWWVYVYVSLCHLWMLYVYMFFYLCIACSWLRLNVIDQLAVYIVLALWFQCCTCLSSSMFNYHTIYLW